MKSKKNAATKTWFTMPYKLSPLANQSQANIRYPEAFVEKFLTEYTRPHDRILDPFAGFGTTLIVAQRMKRIGIGIEYDKKRYKYIQSKLRSPTTVIQGDSRHIARYDIAPCDFCITSPPYMQRHHRQNPLTNYTKVGNYKNYLRGMVAIYSQIKTIMKPSAVIILEIANIYGGKNPMTPLAWDVANELSKILFFERELIYCHTNHNQASNTGAHSYCLVFRNC